MNKFFNFLIALTLCCLIVTPVMAEEQSDLLIKITSHDNSTNFPTVVTPYNNTLEGNITSGRIRSINANVTNFNINNNEINNSKTVKPKIITSKLLSRNKYITYFNISDMNLSTGLNKITIEAKVSRNTISKSFYIIYSNDTDNDGIIDYYEDFYGSNKHLTDSDNDGVLDIEEIFEIGSNPNEIDSDQDGLPDYYELTKLTNITEPFNSFSISKFVSDADMDCDGDFLTNYQEYLLGTDPLKYDTNNNGIGDGIDNINSLNKYRFTYILNDYDLNSKPLIENDTRTFLVKHLQKYLNKIILTDKSLSNENILVENGNFGKNLTKLLIQITSKSTLNYDTFLYIIEKSETSQPVKPIRRSENSTQYKEDVIQFKKYLDNWKFNFENKHTELKSIPSIKLYNGEYNDNLDYFTQAFIRLFQQNNSIPITSIFDRTTVKLLENSNKWTYKPQNSSGVYKLNLQENNTYFKFSNKINSLYDFKYFSQNHGAWSYEPYYAVNKDIPQLSRILSKNGCGPTSLAIIISEILGEDITPDEISRLSMATNGVNEYYDTTANLYNSVASFYNLDVTHTRDTQTLIDLISTGEYKAVASMGIGNLTSGGHIVSIMAVEKLPYSKFSKLLIYDPNQGNKNYFYQNDYNSVIETNLPGIIYINPKTLDSQLALGYWIFKKKSSSRINTNSRIKSSLRINTTDSSFSDIKKMPKSTISPMYSFGRNQLINKGLEDIEFADLDAFYNLHIQAYLSYMSFPIGSYGINKNGIDGDIGPTTDYWIKEFQRVSDLPVMGINYESFSDIISKEEFDKIRSKTLELLKISYLTGENISSLGL